MAEHSSAAGLVVLIADDDPDDRMLTAEALAATDDRSEICFVQDGQDLLDYLQREGQYQDAAVPRPDVILLDLNMPRLSGTEALAEIKGNTDLQGIPVVVLSTSSQAEDINASYHLGAASYVTKPHTFSEYAATLGVFSRYWSQVVKLPRHA